MPSPDYRPMQYSSKTGDNVLHVLGGTGSTLIGARQTGRRVFLMEIAPLYCNVIAQRYEMFTGRKAQHSRLTRPRASEETQRRKSDDVT
jgi:DNA modification methylase